MTRPTPHGQVPEALRLADELEIPIEGYPEATALESQLAQRFDAADMATAAAQGFRDGVASLSANAGEPVYQARYQKGFWQDSSRERYEYLQNPENTCAEDWETRILYTHPPTAQAEGWRLIATAPKDGTYLLLWEQYSTNPFVGCWAFGAWTVSHEHVDAEGGWDGANVVDALSMPITHWMPLPPAPGPADGESNG